MLGTTTSLFEERLVEDRFGGVEGRLMADEFVVELFAEEVGLRHLDADRVAQREAMVGLTANETEVVFVEIESLIAQETDGNESFAVVLVNFSIDAKFAHTADVGIKFFTQFVGHELHLLVFDAGTLG